MKPGARRETLVIVLCVISILGIALWFAGYSTTGLFGRQPSVRLTSIKIHSGSLPTPPSCSATNSAFIIMIWNNTGDSTNISCTSITGSSLPTTIGVFYLRNGSRIRTSFSSEPGIGAGVVSAITLYLGGLVASTLTASQTCNYAINLTNGESFSGSLLAQ